MCLSPDWGGLRAALHMAISDNLRGLHLMALVCCSSCLQLCKSVRRGGLADDTAVTALR